jgi:Flp pilus assembly protein protease CpaA
MELLPLILLAPVLAAVAYFDLRYMRIPNALVLIATRRFSFSASPILGWPEAGHSPAGRCAVSSSSVSPCSP